MARKRWVVSSERPAKRNRRLVSVHVPAGKYCTSKADVDCAFLNRGACVCGLEKTKILHLCVEKTQTLFDPAYLKSPSCRRRTE